MKKSFFKNDKQIFTTRRAKTVALLSILIIAVLLCAMHFVSFAKNQNGVPRTIDVSECVPYGYLQSGNHFTNEVGDAHIQLPELNQYVAGVTVYFSTPLKQSMNTALYYAETDHGYSEDYTMNENVFENSDHVVLHIGKEITTCRIDLGSMVGQEFSLDCISINDGQMLHEMLLLEFFDVFILLSLITCIVVTFLIVVVYKVSIEKVFAILALLIGCLYCILITPLSVPDELHHYHSSYWLSNMLLFQWDNSEYGNSADFDYSEYVDHHNVSSGYLRSLEEIGDAPKEGEDILIPQPRGLSYFVEYLPQALGISLSRITNQNFVRTFYIGRVFNLLFYSMCLYFAVKRAPKFKIMFGLIGLMPMALHQAASYSYDGFVNGISLFLIASLLKAIYEEGPLSKKDYFCILVSAALLTPAKLVYFPILLLVVLIPKDRFRSRKEKIIGIASIWIAGALTIAVFQFHALISLGAGDSRGLNYEGYYNYSISFIFQHPLETIEIFMTTFWQSAIGWLYGAVGQVLSGLTLSLPSWITRGYIALIILSALNHEKSNFVLFAPSRVVLLLASVATIFLTMLSMFLGWTSNFRTIIMGIQGRYFVPIIPLLALSTNNQFLIYRKKFGAVLIVSAVLLHCAALENILSYTLLH